jgi:hypothetical protein
MAAPTDEEIEAIESSAVAKATLGITSTTTDGRSVTVDFLKQQEFARKSRRYGNAFGLVSRAVVAPPGSVSDMGGDLE